MNAKTIAVTALACTVLLGLATGASAQPRQHRERGWHGDVRHFHERDLGRWRGGHWYQGNHGGHFGWWWIVGGVYYWYPRAIYPYPDPFVPPVYIEQPVAPAAPPPSAAPAPTAPAPGAAGTWYYCDSAKSYYPYVADCPGGWRAVPAAPAAPAAPPR